MSQDRMTLTAFINTNKNYGREISGDTILPSDFLESIYNSVKQQEILTPDESAPVLSSVSYERWQDLISQKISIPFHLIQVFPDTENTSTIPEIHDYFLKESWLSQGDLHRCLLLLLWKPITHAISQLFLESNDEIISQNTLMDCILLLAKLSSVHKIQDILDSLITLLCRLTGLLDPSPFDRSDEKNQRYHHLLANTLITDPQERKFIQNDTLEMLNWQADTLERFWQSSVRQMALVNVFAIVHRLGEHICKGWEPLFRLLMRMRDFRILLPQIFLDSGNDFLDKKDRILFNEQLRKTRMQFHCNLVIPRYDQQQTEMISQRKTKSWFSFLDFSHQNETNQLSSTEVEAIVDPWADFFDDEEPRSMSNENELGHNSLLQQEINKTEMIDKFRTLQNDSSLIIKQTLPIVDQITTSNSHNRLSILGTPFSPILSQQFQMARKKSSPNLRASTKSNQPFVVALSRLQQARKQASQVAEFCGIQELIWESRYLPLQAFYHLIWSLVGVVNHQTREQFDKIQLENTSIRRTKSGELTITAALPSNLQPFETPERPKKNLAHKNIPKRLNTFQQSTTPLPTESALAFCEKMLMDFCLVNKDRVHQIWPFLKLHYQERLGNVSELTCVTEKALTGFLNLCVRLMHRDTIASDLFDTLIWMVSVHMNQQIVAKLSQQLSAGLYKIIVNNVFFLTKINTEQWNQFLQILGICASGGGSSATNVFQSLFFLFHEHQLVTCIPETSAFPISQLIRCDFPDPMVIASLDLLMIQYSRIHASLIQLLQNKHEENNLKIFGTILSKNWLPIIQIIVESTNDSRKQIVIHAFTLLHRCLYNQNLFSYLPNSSSFILEVIIPAISKALTNILQSDVRNEVNNPIKIDSKVNLIESLSNQRQNDISNIRNKKADEIDDFEIIEQSDFKQQASELRESKLDKTEILQISNSVIANTEYNTMKESGNFSISSTDVNNIYNFERLCLDLLSFVIEQIKELDFDQKSQIIEKIVLTYSKLLPEDESTIDATIQIIAREHFISCVTKNINTQQNVKQILDTMLIKHLPHIIQTIKVN